MSKPVRPKTRARTDEQRAADDAALLASGEALATLPELAATLGVSVGILRWVMQKKGAPLTRYISSSRPVQHCVADVRAAVEAARPDIEARRKRAEEIDVAERARGEASRAAKAAAPKKPAKGAPSKGTVAKAPPAAPTSKPIRPNGGPEVVVVHRMR